MKERNSQDHLVSHGLVWLASWWRLYFRMLCQPCARAIIGSPCPDHLALPGRSYYSGHMVPFIQLLCPWPSSVSNATTWPVVFLSLFRACEPSMPPAGPAALRLLCPTIIPSPQGQHLAQGSSRFLVPSTATSRTRDKASGRRGINRQLRISLVTHC